MLKFLRSMSAGKLFASWVGYWILLIAIGLGPALAAILRATQAAPDQGTVNVSFGNGAFSLSVLEKGATIYAGSIHVLPLALLVAGPPLALWLLWFASRSKRDVPQATIGG
jgi:hypothetical protein